MGKDNKKPNIGPVLNEKMKPRKVRGGVPNTESQELSETEKKAVEQKIKEIVDESKKIDEYVKSQNFTPEQEKEFYTKKFAELGIKYEDGKIKTIGGGEIGLDPSQFWKGLGWLPVDQMFHSKGFNYHFEKFIGTRLVANGTHLAFYGDYLDADELPAYKIPEGADYVDKLYNPSGTLAFEEQWNVYKDLHKGFKMPSIALNDFTSKPSIFLAALSDFSRNVARPMAKAFYVYRMMMLQDPEHVDDSDNDWSKIHNDLEIEYTTFDDLLFQMRNYEQKLSTISRDTAPETWWPEGAEQGLEFALTPSEYLWITDVRVENAINIFVKSGRYHDDFVDVTSKIDAYDFDETFGKYIGATNYGEKFTETGECNFRYAPLAAEKRNEIIYMYNGIRSQPLLVFWDVVHSYIRYGRFFNKYYPIYKVHAKTKSGKFPPNPNYVSVGSGGQDVITKDNFNATLVADDSFKATNANIGDVSGLKTDAKVVVPAINELNDKKADKA